MLVLIQEPSTPGPEGEAARMLCEIIGPTVHAPDGSLNAAEVITLGALVVDMQDANNDAIAQAYPHTATDTLDRWDLLFRIALGTTLPTARRQALALARSRMWGSASPQAILRALEPFDPGASIVENDAADVTANPELIYEGLLVIDTALFDDARMLSTIKELLRIAKPAYYRFEVAVSSSGFRTASSRLSRDALGW